MQAENLIQETEQRTALRSTVNLPVALSHFHTGRNFKPIEMKTCNQSASGLCIISPHELSTHMMVLVRALKCDPEANPSAPLLRSAAVGEVRWCRRVAAERYLAGIRYF